MARSVFRFLSRQPDTLERYGENSAPARGFPIIPTSWAVAAAALGEPPLPSALRNRLWRPDELTERSFRVRMLRANGQEYASGLAVPMLLFRRDDNDPARGTYHRLYPPRGSTKLHDRLLDGRETCRPRPYVGRIEEWQSRYIYGGLQLHRIEAARDSGELEKYPAFRKGRASSGKVFCASISKSMANARATTLMFFPPCRKTVNSWKMLGAMIDGMRLSPAYRAVGPEASAGDTIVLHCCRLFLTAYDGCARRRAESKFRVTTRRSTLRDTTDIYINKGEEEPSRFRRPQAA